ncbi:FliH/SctL family protein [Pseudarthrobacter sp. BIM B-2242]|uniref:FliH/SctL family protein n=1 Tax=Pseudarthrobacter sp. BIM B-2242 TaxID=2772401 RepID=UPI00168A531D|nr:FliH/SctL family protein [Pseudarthrobacter sp. BIM B-2242]QOD05761.1 hypothetical protein IDT60_22250 [Pseudarthrobacter sp. BIM B-2242]
MTPLSTEPSYKAVTFPSLNTGGKDKADAAAYAAGHTAGYTAGLRKASAEAETRRVQMEAEHAAVLRQASVRTDRALDQLAAAVQALHKAALPSALEAQDILLSSALELAENIIGVELGDGEFSARAALSRALAGAPATGTVTVRMNPSDLSVLPDTARAGVTFTADPSVERGDAFADYEHGYVDATVTDALARTRQALFGVVR